VPHALASLFILGFEVRLRSTDVQSIDLDGQKFRLMADNPKYLTRLRVGILALHLEVRPLPATLAKLAISGDGPAYHWSGRDALYAPADAWAVKLIGNRVFSRGALPRGTADA
jgi:hypothetical protein